MSRGKNRDSLDNSGGYQVESYRYSSLPATAYRITSLAECEISTILDLPRLESVAVWNLAWLSLPAMDSLLSWGTSPQWFRHYMPAAGAMKAIVGDAISDDVLQGWLLTHPADFLDFFRSEDHTIYECYEALGEQVWVSTVIRRAEESAARAPARPGRGNVLPFTPKST